MPFRSLTAEEPSRITSRVALMGPPGTWKSTALLTWPKPVHVVSIPGEKGWATLQGVPGVTVEVWETEDPTKLSPYQVCTELERLVNGIISGIVSGKNPARTLALDGLHKMYGHYYKRERMSLESWSAAGKSDTDIKLTKDLRAYQFAHDAFSEVLTRWLTSRVPYMVATFWEGVTKDDPEDKMSKGHIYPDLPGKMANWIVGEFNAVLYHEVGKPAPNGKMKGEWVLRPEGKVWGVGVKARPEVAEKLPPRIPIGFSHFASLVGEPTE